MPRSTPSLFAAPHRLFFLLGAGQLIVSMLLWLLILSGRYLASVPLFHLAIAGTPLHVFLMVYGVFTFFVFGFLSTVFPRWLATPPIAASRYVRIALCMFLGVFLVYVGLVTDRLVVLAGCLVLIVGWGAGIATLVNVWRRSERPNKYFALLPLFCISAGLLGLCCFTFWLGPGPAWLLTLSTRIGLWLYLVLLIVAVSHRMLPFFSASVLADYRRIHPGWTVPATLACLLVHTALTVSGQAAFSVICDLPLAVIAAWHSYQWGLARSLRVPLLAMLHIAFAWLAIAMALYAVQSALILVGSSVHLGRAPLHALAIGFVASMVVAMASRVCLGHSGRALVADGVAIAAFALIQLTTVVRVLAEIPPLAYSAARPELMLIAAVLWLIACIPWGLRYGAIVLRPRIDGGDG